jgi:hypothetical protein
LKAFVAAFRRACIAPIVLAVSAVSLPADAYEPVLHEFIPEDPREDVALAVTTVEGDLPAALQTSSGLVRAPDTQRAPTAGDNAFAEQMVGTGRRSTFHMDRDTHMPDLVRYDDPFSPTIAPYKRLRAFDQVEADYGLRVRDTALSRIPVGGEIAAGEDAFYGDLTIDLTSETPVRIPSVGPGARVLRMHVTPPLAVEISRDGADNWFARSLGQRRRVRAIMEVAIPRAVLGGEPPLPSWDGMPAVAPLPPRADRAAQTVAAVVGVSRADSPGEAVRKLVGYFRSFAPSDDFPRGQDDIYLDLALSKKGVCRHRAFAFLITALGLGIPARMVTNEAHAWVEVQGERFFHRIDLGGAARAIDESGNDSSTAYQPSSDPFPWPLNADRGASTQVVRSNSGGQPGSATANASAPNPVPYVGQPVGTSAAVSMAPAPLPSHVSLRNADHEVQRGNALRVAGTIETDGAACSQIRVDVALVRGQVKIRVGSLVTDIDGVFSGAIVVPMSVVVGDYRVLVSTPGDSRCGAGASDQ